MKRLTVLLMIATSACVHRMSTEMQKWVGTPETELVSKWGAPEKETTLSDGTRVMTWSTKWTDSDGEKRDCRQSFTIGPTHTVTAWSTSGCSALYLRR